MANKKYKNDLFVRASSQLSAITRMN